MDSQTRSQAPKPSQRFRGLGLLLLLVTAHFACSTHERDNAARFDAHFLAGKQAFAKRDFRDAAEKLDLALDIAPEHPEALNLRLMVSLLSSGGAPRSPDEKREERRKRELAVEQYKTDLAVIFHEAQEFERKGQTDQASAAYRTVLERIHWAPYPIDDLGLAQQARRFLASIKKSP